MQLTGGFRCRGCQVPCEQDRGQEVLDAPWPAQSAPARAHRRRHVYEGGHSAHRRLLGLLHAPAQYAQRADAGHHMRGEPAGCDVPRMSPRLSAALGGRC